MADDAADDGDDGADMVAPAASDLSGKQLAEELIARGIKPSGFPEDDIKMLQKHLTAEFEAEKETRIKERREALKKRRAEEEALRMQRFLEKQKREEEEAVAQSPHLAFLIEQLRANTTAPDMVVRERPVAVRAFLKAAIASGNSSVRSLDLVGCALGDDVGVEVGALLRINKGLRRLELDYNAFGPKTLAAIALGLQSNTTLQALSLEHNRLTGDVQYSAAALAAAAADAADAAAAATAAPSGTHAAPPHAPSAALAQYAPDLAGVVALAGTLKSRNSTLEALNLFQTGLTAAGGRMLADALQHNQGLSSLTVSVADGLEAADLAAITPRLLANAEARVRQAAAAKAQRAAARRLLVEQQAAELAKGAFEAEARWIQSEKDARERVRADVEFEAYRKDRMAVIERENQEKLRKDRLRQEAEEKAKKAKKK